MKIWIIDHYSVPVKFYPLARNTNFAKNLIKMGHEVTIFAASTVHNSIINLIEADTKYNEIVDDGVKYVIIGCHSYTGNGIKRILNMYEFARKLDAVCGQYPRPDAIISTSMTLQACKKGIQLSQKYGCRKIAQITDLWPETLVAYGRATAAHPLVILFRNIEKWIYKNADRIIFSMEGAYDYIVEQGWEGDIPRSKVSYINNGVELDEFYRNRDCYQIDDSDLKNREVFKAVYIGSIRQVNSIGMLVEAAQKITNPRIKILIWGDGDQKKELEQVCKDKGIHNIVFKGRVEKKYVPYITTNADLNLAHSLSTELFRFGMSLNKMFDYAAGGKPILVDFEGKYNPVIEIGAGISTSEQTAEAIARGIERFAAMDSEEYKGYCDRAVKMSQEYNISKLTEKLLSVVRNEDEDGWSEGMPLDKRTSTRRY